MQGYHKKQQYDLSSIDNMLKSDNANEQKVENSDGTNTNESIIDILKRRQQNQNSNEKHPVNDKKWKIIFWIIYSIILIIELEIYEGIVTIKDFIKIESTSNPFIIIAEAIVNHPIALIVMLVLSYILTRLIVKAVKNRKTEVRDERGILLDDSNTAGASRLMTDKEKRKLFHYLSYNHPEGNILGVDKKTRELITVPFENSNFSNRNIGLFGPPGMRKTSGVLIPNIFSNIQAGNSIVCSDPKGELYKETYAAARFYNYNVRVFNILGTQFQKSDGWDCLKTIRESPNPQSTAQVFAHILLSNTSGSSGDDFWWDANINCCMLALLYVAKANGFVPYTTRSISSEAEEGTDANFEKQRTLKEVYNLLTSEDMEDILKRTIEADPSGDARLLRAPFNIWAKHREKDSIRAGLGIRLNILQSEEVADILSTDDIDFHELATEKTIIYIICADNDDTYKSLLTLFVTFMFRETTAIADSLPGSTLARPLFVILEECGNIGKIPNLSRYVSTVRSRNIGMLFCFQTLGQMKDIYGAVIGGKYEWETILAGCSIQLCLGANDDTTAEYFSTRSGTMSTISVQEGEHRNKLFPEGIQKYTVLDKNQKTSIKPRITMLPDEIKHIKKNEILISPSMDNVTLENKYFYKDHPLYRIVLVDKTTGEIVPEHLTKDRVPAGKGEMSDEERYVAKIGDRISPLSKPEVPSTDLSSREDSGRSYDAFLRK